MQSKLVNKIFETNISFDEKAIEIFKFQYHQNPVYARWCNALRVKVSAVDVIEKIPYLPISFYKSKKIVSGKFQPEITFKSSGTTKLNLSRHFVKDIEVYKTSFLKSFEIFYGDIQNYCLIALLPSYIEAEHSSLVYMANDLIKKSNNPFSGFYLYNFESLHKMLEDLEKANQKTLLLGVSYALLDFSEQFRMNLRNTIVMETGGMKGRKVEITREELHSKLKMNLGVKEIHSEYGMTELLSQAYSKEMGLFTCPPWMKVLVRDEQDPLEVSVLGKGVMNVIDFANINSCSFIATDDVCIINDEGRFFMKGRLDESDMRGCNLLIA